MLEGSAAITALVILNFIGCGLLPKGAAFHFKEQAILPKQAWKSKLIKIRQIAHLTEEELEEQMAARNLCIGHLCKSLIFFPSSLFLSLTSS